MKVIFLDVDGVLNSEKFWEEQTQSFRYTAALNEGKTDDEISVIANFDPDAGLLRPIYGITPFSKDRHRGTEIKKWLNDHPEVTHYVIIDDDNDMLDEQLNNFVQTSWAEGLNEECADKAVEILNKEVC